MEMIDDDCRRPWFSTLCLFGNLAIAFQCGINQIKGFSSVFFKGTKIYSWFCRSDSILNYVKLPLSNRGQFEKDIKSYHERMKADLSWQIGCRRWKESKSICFLLFTPTHFAMKPFIQV